MSSPEPRVFNKRGPVPVGAVYVGRPTKFGNPFVIGRDGNRDEVVRRFEEWIDTQPNLIDAARSELRGKNLVCWCAPLACHADVLLMIANEN
ncbi:MAG: DUF4326 domain-containing protein [Burkholderiaceae bacterium]|nr:MAG: DUF4326 domain-containing protein [Burkholderiaceae bacterium]TBR76765.1 MAG: DUF4326 domain-containing protein [Burkholderiaceae bacterium]